MSSYQMRYFFLCLVTFLSATYSAVSSAVIMRHDVSPTAYLLDINDYPSTVDLKACTGVFVHQRWIMTAAHCLEGSDVLSANKAVFKDIHLHPGYKIKDGSTIHDIALIELTEPEYDAQITPVYEGQEEAGQILKVTGFGKTGNGKAGLDGACGPCPLRGFDNLVTEVNQYHLRFFFDHPDSPNALYLEGVSGPGDSGAPAYIETEEGRFVAGIGSFGSNYYFDHDNFTRVSSELGWIAETMAEDYEGNYSGPLYSDLSVGDEQIPSYGGSLPLNILGLLVLLLIGRLSNRRL